MKHILRFLLTSCCALGLSLSTACAADTAQKNEIIHHESFQNTSLDAVLKNWKLSPDGGAPTIDQNALCFQVPAAPTPVSNKIVRTIPTDKIRGGTLYVSALVEAKDVTKKPNPWNGIKLLVQIDSEDGIINYPQADIPVGTFPETKVGFPIQIPLNSKSVKLVLGLEAVSGTIWVKNINISLIEAYKPVPPRTGDPTKKGHPLPLLRGAMVPTGISAEDLRVLGQEWNANVIRWQVGQLSYRQGLDTPGYDKILADELVKFDNILPICRKYGLYVVLDLHSLSRQQFSSLANQDKLVEVWKMLATKYKDNPVIWGYDIANEPAQNDWKEGALLWNGLAERLCQEIRKIDPVKPLIVEPALMGNPEGFGSLRPVSVDNVIYSVHLYNPGQLTHNRVFDKKQTPVTYPGKIGDRQWNKAEIERTLSPVIDFQKKYGVPIFVGEFSCVRWSPGAAQYLQDCIEVFEKYNWDWTYHAFREWDGWSVEHSADPSDAKPSTTPSEAQKVLRAALAKNKKPSWTGK